MYCVIREPGIQLQLAAWCSIISTTGKKYTFYWVCAAMREISGCVDCIEIRCNRFRNRHCYLYLHAGDDREHSSLSLYVSVPPSRYGLSLSLLRLMWFHRIYYAILQGSEYHDTKRYRLKYDVTRTSIEI